MRSEELMYGSGKRSGIGQCKEHRGVCGEGGERLNQHVALVVSDSQEAAFLELEVEPQHALAAGEKMHREVEDVEANEIGVEHPSQQLVSHLRGGVGVGIGEEGGEGGGLPRWCGRSRRRGRACGGRGRLSLRVACAGCRRAAAAGGSRAPNLTSGGGCGRGEGEGTGQGKGEEKGRRGRGRGRERRGETRGMRGSWRGRG